jgi:hypothetical protein
MDSSSLPPSSPPQASSPVRRYVLDPYAAISGSKATEPWRPPRFAKRERSPESTNSSPAYHKRVRTEDFPSSPFGTRDLPATSSPPFGSPQRHIPDVPRSPIKQSLYEKQDRIWADCISALIDDVRENGIDLRLALPP